MVQTIPAQTIPMIAQIALPVALPHSLQYRVPPELEATLRPGHRVRVPLRGRETHGIVLAVAREAAPQRKLRPLLAIEPAEVLIEGPLLELITWMARYYVAPIGIAMEAAVPRAVLRPARVKAASREARAPESGAAAAPGAIGTTGAPGATSAPLTPESHQSAALERITQALAAGSGETFLLQGVTGSGKTEVYMQAIASALALGKSALVLVPEIAIGTLVLERVRERFGPHVAEYHSQMKPGERRQAWWDARHGRARIVVGARSALFAPVRDLGLVVVDEEHEPAYKQTETPRYHGRDTALMRAHLAGAVSVLGSATPSLESRTNAAAGKYTRLLLPDRVAGRPQPRVTLADLRMNAPAAPAAPTTAGASAGTEAGALPVVTGSRDPGEPLSPYLLERLRATLTAGDQAILFLNRRGHSTSVQCQQCGHVFECARCSVVLTYHKSERVLRCHYCNYRVDAVEACPQCNGVRFAYTGVGTQKVEAALALHVPAARVLRMDLDSTRKRGAVAGILGAFERREADVLLGTQMVAKGFDFPHVTLVGVISADREMGLPDFRAQERAFQLLTQVAGRAGRGAKPGEVVFQTYMPQHHVIIAAGLQDYELFYEKEMEERRALRYPPFRRMASLLFDGPDEAAVSRWADRVAERLAGRRDLELLGPAPMALSRLKGQFRWQLTLASSGPGILARAVGDALEQWRTTRPAGRVRLQVDMDPVSLL
jgi:primosomal protein N' (replication factor Y) (superfamily II helicase)